MCQKKIGFFFRRALDNVFEFKEVKQKLIDDLYVELGALSDRYLFNHKSEFVTKEYLVEYELLKKQIKELEK